MPSATPADVLARRRHLILNGDADGFADLFSPDGVIEAPFAGPTGMPARLEGREAIREYSRHVMASPLSISWRRRARTSAGVADGVRVPFNGPVHSTAVH